MITVNNKEFDVITHGGVFHQDEVVATVLLSYALNKPNLIVGRLQFVPQDFSGIVYDVGRGEFDHHFKPVKTREDGRVYSSAGLIWEKFKDSIIENMPIEDNYKEFIKEALKEGNDFIDEKVIYAIDALDNGVNLERPTPFGGMLAPLAYIDDKNKGFELAVQYVEPILLHLFRNETSKLMQKKDFDRFYKNSREKEMYKDVNALYLEHYVPYKDFLFTDGKDKDIDFVISPSLRGGYQAEAIADGPMSFNNKRPFPEAWRGLPQDELRKVSGISDAIFCHNSGFLFSAESLSSTIQACKKNLKENK